MNYISLFAMPALFVLFLGLGFARKVNVYDCFVEGAGEGLRAVVRIVAPLVGLTVAVTMFRASGALDILANLLAPILEKLHFPADVLPLALLRPISGSASTAIVADIFRVAGPDSDAGKIASVMMGSTETTFYTIAVYFGAVGVKNTRHTLPAALLADATGILLAVFVTRWMLFA